MKGLLQFKEELQGDVIVVAVYFNSVECGTIIPEPDRGAWYKWGTIKYYELSIKECKHFVIELFNQLDSFVQKLENK